MNKTLQELYELYNLMEAHSNYLTIESLKIERIISSLDDLFGAIRYNISSEYVMDMWQLQKKFNWLKGGFDNYKLRKSLKNKITNEIKTFAESDEIIRIPIDIIQDSLDGYTGEVELLHHPILGQGVCIIVAKINIDIKDESTWQFNNYLIVTDNKQGFIIRPLCLCNGCIEDSDVDKIIKTCKENNFNLIAYNSTIRYELEDMIQCVEINDLEISDIFEIPYKK